MRRLILVRHAKSSWSDSTLDDHDRPLNARGHRAAELVGTHLHTLGCTPDLVLSSSALRTRQSWQGMSRPLGNRPQISFHRALYLASPDAVLERIAAAPASARTVMALGHNPATHALAAYLAREGEPAAMARLGVRFPTGAAAILELYDEHWTGVAGGGRLAHFILPRELERDGDCSS